MVEYQDRMTLIETESKAYLQARDSLKPILSRGEYTVQMRDDQFIVRWIEPRPYPLKEYVKGPSKKSFESIPDNILSYYYYMMQHQTTARGVLIGAKQSDHKIILTYGLAKVAKHELVLGALKEVGLPHKKVIKAATSQIPITFASGTMEFGGWSHHTSNSHQIDLFIQKDESQVTNEMISMLSDIACASLMCLSPAARTIANSNWSHDAHTSYSLHAGNLVIDHFHNE